MYIRALHYSYILIVNEHTMAVVNDLKLRLDEVRCGIDFQN